MNSREVTLRFDRRVGIVTGVRRGFGRAYTLELTLAARCLVKDISCADAVVVEIAASGGTLQPLTGIPPSGNL